MGWDLGQLPRRSCCFSEILGSRGVAEQGLETLEAQGMGKQQSVAFCIY